MLAGRRTTLTVHVREGKQGTRTMALSLMCGPLDPFRPLALCFEVALVLVLHPACGLWRSERIAGNCVVFRRN
jgi:hypothetical protein